MTRMMSSSSQNPAGGTKAQVTPLPGSPNDALRDMVKRIETMLAVYDQETEALNATDSKTFLELQDKKIEAVQRYQSGMAQLMAYKEELKAADPALKNQIRDMQVGFAEKAQKNMDALARMKRCTERLGNTLRHAAVASVQQQRTYSYGENGSITGGGLHKPVSSGLSETA